MKIKHLFEAKFSSPVIAYHGTTSENLDSILSQGLLYREGGGWGSNLGGSENSRIMDAAGGVYLARGYEEAKNIANNVSRVNGGNPVVVTVQVQERSAILDEDDAHRSIQSWISEVARHNNFNVDKVGVEVIYNLVTDPRGRYSDAFVDGLFGDMRGLENYYPNEFFNSIVISYFARILSYYVDKGKLSPYKVADIIETRDVDLAQEFIDRNIPLPAEAEQNYKQALNRFSIAMKKRILSDDRHHLDTLRMRETIGYRGSNKIVKIEEFVDGVDYDPIVRYG